MDEWLEIEGKRAVRCDWIFLYLALIDLMVYPK